MFGVGFYFDESYDEPGWSVEFVTDDFGEAIDDLFDARNDAAAGDEIWDGSRLMILVLRDGKTSWELLTEETFAE